MIAQELRHPLGARLWGRADGWDYKPSISSAAAGAPFWRYSREDGIYNSALVLLHSGRASREPFVGHQVEVQVDWRISRHLSATVNYAHFFAGPFIKDTGPGIDYVTGWVTYRF